MIKRKSRKVYINIKIAANVNDILLFCSGCFILDYDSDNVEHASTMEA